MADKSKEIVYNIKTVNDSTGIDALNKDLVQTVKTFGNLELKLEKLNDEFKNVEVGSTRFKELQTEIAGVSTELKNIELGMEGLDTEQVASEFGGLVGGIGDVTAAMMIFGDAEDKTMVALQENLNKGVALSMGLKGAIEGVSAGMKLWRVIQVQVNALMAANPVGAWVTAAVALVAVVGAVAYKMNEASSATEAFSEGMGEAAVNASKEISELNKLITTIENTTEATDERNDAIDDYNDKFGEYGGFLNKEAIAQDAITAAQNRATKSIIHNMLVKQQAVESDKALEKYIKSLVELNREMVDDNFSTAQITQINNIAKARQEATELWQISQNKVQEALASGDKAALKRARDEVTQHAVTMAGETKKINALEKQQKGAHDYFVKLNQLYYANRYEVGKITKGYESLIESYKVGNNTPASGANAGPTTEVLGAIEAQMKLVTELKDKVKSAKESEIAGLNQKLAIEEKELKRLQDLGKAQKDAGNATASTSRVVKGQIENLEGLSTQLIETSHDAEDAFNKIGSSADESSKSTIDSVLAMGDALNEFIKNADAAAEDFSERVSDAVGETLSTAFSMVNENIQATLETTINAENALYDQQLIDADNYHTEQQDLLQSRLDKGLISQATYETELGILNKKSAKEKEKLEKEKIAKENELRKKQFNANKILSLSEIAIDTVKAVMGDTARYGAAFAAPFVMLDVAAGLLAAGQVVAQQYVPIAKDGGYIVGDRHSASSGGVMIQAEGTEMIMNSPSVQKYAPTLNAMNADGRSGGNGDLIDYERLGESVGTRLNQQEVVIVDKKISNSQKEVDILDATTSF